MLVHVDITSPTLPPSFSPSPSSLSPFFFSFLFSTLPPPSSPPSSPPSLTPRATSPGKLLQYTVEDGHHVRAGKPYAEIEVMKMVTTLITMESGM